MQISLLSVPNPSNYGQAVTFTASVSSGSFSGPVPTGTVDFMDGQTDLGTRTLDHGSVTLTALSLAAGTHSVTAKYSGDGNFPSLTSKPDSQVVKQDVTSTGLNVSPAISAYGHIVTFTVTVASSYANGFIIGPIPDGTVNIFAGSTVIGTGVLNKTGTATITKADLGAGTYTITAKYEGNNNFSSSTSLPRSELVNPPPKVSAEIDINDTPGTSDNITLFNSTSTGEGYTQSIPAKITNTGNTTGTFALSVEPPQAASLDRSSVTLAPGKSTDVTITPKADSTVANDVHIVATQGGTRAGEDDMTIVSVLFPPHIRAEDTPAGMTDRIPPRIATPLPVTVIPNLAGSGQSIELAVSGQSANNGLVTINGVGTVSIASTQTINLSSPNGSTQTAATGEFKGDNAINVGMNAGKLKLTVRAHGQDTIQTFGFSVAAIPQNFSNTFSVRSPQPPVKTHVGYIVAGMIVDWNLQSDSGMVSDLDAVEVSEEIGFVAATGALSFPLDKLFYENSTSGYSTAQHTNSTYDTHTAIIFLSSLIRTGTLTLSQLFVYRDKRTGGVDIPMPHSGFIITQNLFEVGGRQYLTTAKGPSAVAIGSLSSTEGVGGTVQRTQLIE